MQPYFFPYLGYFQLIRHVDTFVICDDCNHITRGWINRNYIQNSGRPLRITLSLHHASINRKINETAIADNKEKILKSIRHTYSRAPLYRNVYPLIESIILNPDPGLATYLEHELKSVCQYLELFPKWLRSSSIDYDRSLSAEQKIIAICKQLGADHYINLPGGIELYKKENFSTHGIQLNFIRPGNISYKQFGNTFIPNLSIIDILMFNDKTACSKLLDTYTLM